MGDDGTDYSGLFGPSVLTGDSWGQPNSDMFLTSQASGGDDVFPWLSNAPDGSVFSQSNPAIDFLNSSAGASGDSGFNLTGGTGGFSMPNLNFGGYDLLGSLGNMLPSASTGMRALPGAMALTYALGQPGIDTGQLNSILGSLGGSQDAIVRAAVDPVQANTAAGYGDLLQSQAQRGIRGSSFGDTDIANYLSTTGRAVANAGASASQGSMALQGNLAAQIATLKNASQQQKNDLFGRAFDVIGRGLNPSGYTGTTNINVGGGGGQAVKANDNGFLGTGISTGEIGAGVALASLFSDRRLKSNIVKVGEDERGFGIYEYDIFGERQRGVMADEVELIVPRAVHEVAGMKMVDYGRLYG